MRSHSHRLTQGAWQQRTIIEGRLRRLLALAPPYSAAGSNAQRHDPNDQRHGNGHPVSLPGMMTGQILAGVSPIQAVKYQILVIFLIAAGTGFGPQLAVECW